MSDASPLAEYPKTVVLKDGLHLVLRPLTPADAEGLRALGDDGGPGLCVIALEGERVAAALRLVPELGRGAHHVSLSMDPEYRGRRLGTWMLLDAVHLAAGLGIEELLARAASDDTEYLAALRRLDFVEEMRMPEEARGGVVVLAKRLHMAWTDF